MVSTEQIYKSSFAQSNSSLKEGMVKPGRAVKKQLTGKRHGSYNVQSSTRRNYSVVTITKNEDTVTHNGEKYFLNSEGGRVNMKHKVHYMLVKHSRVHAKWNQTIMPLLSNSKAEQARNIVD